MESCHKKGVKVVKLCSKAHLNNLKYISSNCSYWFWTVVNASWPFWPSFKVLIRGNNNMYPPVIWLGEQKWQVSLKSAQVDHPLIPKAHALKDSHNCCLRFRGTGVPGLPTVRPTDLIRFPQCHPCLLIKSAADPRFFPCVPPLIVFYLIDVDWGRLSPRRESQHSVRGPKCLHALIWLYSEVCWPSLGSSSDWGD